MPIAVLAAAVLASQGAPDPYLLPIGREGRVKVEMGVIVDTTSGKTVTVADIAKAADGKHWVYLGENHATTAHQQLQAEVIQALAKRGRKVIVGLEMITRPKQTILDEWTQTAIPEAQFLEKLNWKQEWGFDFAFYRPVFEVARREKLPMVALNVPRDWVRQVGREGAGALSIGQRAQISPDLYMGNAAHRSIFGALMGGHPPTGARGENIYAAQVLWDEAMADTALRFMIGRRQPETVFVIIAGSGHIMYNQGINYRIERRIGDQGVTLVMIQGDGAREVAKGMGDYVFLSQNVEKAR